MKRVLLPIVQIAITVALLWWIFHDPQKRADMALALQKADYWWLFAGIVAVGCASFLQAERWRLLLGVQEIVLTRWRVWRLTVIGMFFSLFLPGGTGGDLVKIFYAMKETTSKKSAALLSVLVDRMMGLLALVGVTCVIGALRLPLLLSKPDTRALLGGLLVILGASVGLVIAGFIVDRFNLARHIPNWLPLRAKIIEFSSAFSVYARSPKVMGATFLISVPAHLLYFLSFYFAARAFGLFGGPSGVLDVFSVLPIIQTIASLPVSFSGVGVREGLFQSIFSELYGTPESMAALISISGFCMLVVWQLIGGAIYLTYRPSGGVHLKEVEEEVAAVEEQIEKEA